jgi:hypothetical protein
MASRIGRQQDFAAIGPTAAQSFLGVNSQARAAYSLLTLAPSLVGTRGGVFLNEKDGAPSPSLTRCAK